MMEPDVVPVDTLRHASPEDTRERILAAAREVIAKKGKRGATTREIADVAGVNEATLFRHFGNKAALIIAVAQHFCGFVELRSLTSQLNGAIEDDLFVIGKTMLDRMESQADMIRWSLVEADYEQDLFAETAWRPQLAILELVTAFLQARIDAGQLRGDATKMAMVFMGLIFMHVMARKKFSTIWHADDEAALRLYVDVFLNGVRSK